MLQFTTNAGTPSITSFFPASGSAGTLVTITGSNLDSVTTLNIGGVAAIKISNTDTTVVGMVIPGAITGIVSATSNNGIAVAANNFIVTPTEFPSIQQGNKLIPTGNVGTPSFGRSIAISADGNTAIVGENWDNSYVGAAWVYVRNGTQWTQQGNKLVGSDGSGFYLEYSVAISADGNTAIIGSPNDSIDLGGAYIFVRA